MTRRPAKMLVRLTLLLWMLCLYQGTVAAVVEAVSEAVPNCHATDEFNLCELGDQSLVDQQPLLDMPVAQRWSGWLSGPVNTGFHDSHTLPPATGPPVYLLSARLRL